MEIRKNGIIFLRAAGACILVITIRRKLKATYEHSYIYVRALCKHLNSTLSETIRT